MPATRAVYGLRLTPSGPVTAERQSRADGDGFRLAVDVGAPEQLDTYVRAEEVRWRKVVKDNHITTD